MVDLPAPDSPVSHRTHGFWPLRLERAPLSILRSLPVDVGGAAQGKGDHAAGDRRVGHPVDQDEAAHVAVLGIGIECDGVIEREIAERDLVELEVRGRDVLERIHVDLVLELGHLRRRQHGPDLQEIGSARQHRLLAHPDDMGGKLLGDRGPRIVGGDHIAAADIDLLGKRQRHRLSGHGLIQVAIAGDDARDLHRRARRQDREAVARAHFARDDRSAIATEVALRAD